jgi:hypothetical protein
VSKHDAAAFLRWRRIFRWADGHEPEKAERAKVVMAALWSLLKEHERAQLKRDS